MTLRISSVFDSSSPILRNKRIRAANNAALLALMIVILIAAPMQKAQHKYRSAKSLSALANAFAQAFNCPENIRTDLIFLIDKSGSMAATIDQPNVTPNRGRGQTYNLQIKGLLRALNDESIIPRDGSVSVAVLTFAGNTSIPVELTPLTNDSVSGIICRVENLKCNDPIRTFGCHLTPNVETESCPAGDTFFANAIIAASEVLNNSPNPAARRIVLMSTDGDPDDLAAAEIQSKRFEQFTDAAIKSSELDVILLGSRTDTNGSHPNKEKVDRIVFPDPVDVLPGKTLIIESGVCNEPGRRADDPDIDVINDCNRQIEEFADYTRSVLQTSRLTRKLKVTTDVDTEPGEPPGQTLSLRQAIEEANRCGSTTITFAESVKEIKLRTDLPPLASPNIVIDGIDRCDQKKASSVVMNGVADADCISQVTLDGTGRIRDGIQVISNRDTIRGLRIINFQRSGIAINPHGTAKNTSNNRIEFNSFEDNKEAGVLVLNTFSEAGRTSNNIGNTISCNAVTGSLVPIDLRDDTTAPEPPALEVIQSNDSAMIKAILPTTMAGATVEVFAVNSIRVDSNKVFMDAVVCRKSGLVELDGSLVIRGVAVSPTCAYAATITDKAGTTSELGFNCGCPSKAVADVSSVAFGERPALSDPLSVLPSGILTIRNTGTCSFVNLRSFSFLKDVKKKKNQGDDRNLFFITMDEAGRTLLGENENINIAPGSTQKFQIFFRSVIPPLDACRTTNSTPNIVLPGEVKSRLLIQEGLARDDQIRIDLSAGIDTKVRFINPNCDGPIIPPSINFTKSDDQFIITFAVFDSNSDVIRVAYDFIDKKGGVVKPRPSDTDLRGKLDKLPTGKTFKATQRFSGAKDHPEIVSVLVTIFDNESNDKITGQLSTSSGIAKNRLLNDSMTETLSLPVVKLTPNKRSLNARKSRKVAARMK